MTHSNIFISYRRDDSAGYARLLLDRLNMHFPNRVFMDASAIAPGVDFVEAIERALRTCNALLVLIGPQWLSTTDAEGKRRLEDPDDFVNLEIATALEHNIQVIPVLLRGASMPAPSELPETIGALARHQALEVRDATLDHDVDRLIKALKPTRTRRSWLYRSLASLGILLTIIVIAINIWPDPVFKDPPITSDTTDSGTQEFRFDARGRWRVAYQGQASGTIALHFKDDHTYEIENGGDNQSQQNGPEDMEEAIGDLVRAFDQLAQTQTPTSDAVRTLLGATGTWTFDPNSRRLTLLPTGLRAGLGIDITKKVEEDVHGTDNAGVTFVFTRQ